MRQARRPLSTLSVLGLTSAAWLWAPAASAQDLPIGPPTEARVEVFYTGFTGGLAASRIDFAELKPLYLPDATRDFEVGGFSVDNVFRLGPFLLYTENGPLTIADFQGFFAAGQVQIQPLGDIPMMASDYTYMIPGARGSLAAPPAWPVDWLYKALAKQGGFADTHRITAKRYQLVNAHGVKLGLIGLGDMTPTPALWEDPTHWEMLPAGTVSLHRGDAEASLLSVGRPLGDGLRRAHMMLDMRREAQGANLTIDCGNLLDPGYTELSREERELSFQRLGGLGYDLVVPAETELLLPDEDFKRLRSLVPLVACNLKAKDPKALPLPPYLIRQAGGLKIGVIGLVDDHSMELHGATGPDTPWQATDALAAVHGTLDTLIKQEKPDVVLIATNVRDARLGVLRQLLGVTAVLGDFDGLPGDVFTDQVDVSGELRARSLQTYMVAQSSPNRVGHFTGIYQRQPGGATPNLVRLRNEAHLVTDGQPEQADWRWKLNLAQDRFQKARRAILLPDLREVAKAVPGLTVIADGALPGLDTPRWTRLVANVLREATHTEVAITRELPLNRTVLGPVSQLAIENWLDVGDHAFTTHLTGKDLKGIVAANATAGLLTFSGLDPASGKVQGFAINDDEIYHVATTDMVAHHARFHDFFALAKAIKPGSKKELQLLRGVVLEDLKQAGVKAGGSGTPAFMDMYAGWLQPQGAKVEPRWVARISDTQLLMSGYQNMANADYSQVRNTRVTTPNSFALGGKGAISTTYESRDWAWENGAKAKYKRNSLTQAGTAISQKADDEIDLTSELRLTTFHSPMLDIFTPTPFVNSTYITQFQPDDPIKGVVKPRRSELQARGGLVIHPTGIGFKEMRAGAVLRDDFARPGEVDPGFQLAAIYQRKLSDTGVVFDASIDAAHFLPTATDGPDRLGWEIDTIGKISVPLVKNLTLDLSADYFLYQGKVPATSLWGSSLDFRMGLGYALGFKPIYGDWF